ncbi:MAG: hypothetical protein ACYDDR_13900 [Acidithiobacillus ferrivorans]
MKKLLAMSISVAITALVLVSVFAGAAMAAQEAVDTSASCTVAISDAHVSPDHGLPGAAIHVYGTYTGTADSGRVQNR